MNKALVVAVLWCCCGILTAYAESCPAPEKIRERKLSTQYEWTVDEKTTLENLLSVKKLYAVRIMAEDAYVACHYTTGKWPIKLDMSPAGGTCTPEARGDHWLKTESGQIVCQEPDLGKCEFRFACDD